MALITPIVAAGQTSSPLLTDAPLCLLAGRVVDYQPGGPWKNLGTAGDALDAEVVSQPDFVDDTSGGPGFKREIPEPTPPHRPRVGTFDNRMFDIPGSLLAPGDTDPFTVTIATTPLYPHPESVRYLWKYSNTSLPPSPAGLVIENVATFPNGDDVGHGLIAAIYNGPLATPPTFLGGATARRHPTHPTGPRPTLRPRTGPTRNRRRRHRLAQRHNLRAASRPYH